MPTQLKKLPTDFKQLILSPLNFAQLARQFLPSYFHFDKNHCFNLDDVSPKMHYNKCSCPFPKWITSNSPQSSSRQKMQPRYLIAQPADKNAAAI